MYLTLKFQNETLFIAAPLEACHLPCSFNCFYIYICNFHFSTSTCMNDLPFKREPAELMQVQTNMVVSEYLQANTLKNMSDPAELNGLVFKDSITLFTPTLATMCIYGCPIH